MFECLQRVVLAEVLVSRRSGQLPLFGSHRASNFLRGGRPAMCGLLWGLVGPCGGVWCCCIMCGIVCCVVVCGV